MNRISFDYLTEFLSVPRKIAITSHFNPDGDAVGSSLALFHVLSRSGHFCTVIFPNHFPDFLSWLKGAEQCLIFEKDREKVLCKVAEAEVIFSIDYNSPGRVSELEHSLRTSKAIKILIDHHPNPEDDFFDYSQHSTSISSSAELVFQFIHLLGKADEIDRTIAECIYTGLITDTGSFSYNCNHAESYRLVAWLIDRGLNAERAHRLIFDNFSENRLRLIGYAISEKLQVYPDIRTAIIPLSLEDLKRFSDQPGITEGIANLPLSMKLVNLSVLLTQRSDRIRMSFRSKGEFPVNTIASRYFSGGGHRNAAGGDSFDSMENTIKKLLEILQDYKNQLNFEIV